MKSHVYSNHVYSNHVFTSPVKGDLTTIPPNIVSNKTTLRSTTNIEFHPSGNIFALNRTLFECSEMIVGEITVESPYEEQRDFLGTPKCQGVRFSPIRQIRYFCSGPISADPICPQPRSSSPSSGTCSAGGSASTSCRRRDNNHNHYY